MTHSEVSIDKTFGFYDVNGPATQDRHITATSDGAEGDPVDIVCLGSAFSKSTTLGPNGSLDDVIPESGLWGGRAADAGVLRRDLLVLQPHRDPLEAHLHRGPRRAQLVSITDELTNTDSGGRYDYDLDFEQYQFPGHHDGFRFPGESGYAMRAANDVVSSGFGPITTIGFKLDTTRDTTDEDNPLGSITVSPQPVRALFMDYNEFYLQFTGTIPAGGTKTIRWLFAMGTSESDSPATRRRSRTAGPPRRSRSRIRPRMGRP